MRCFPLYYNTFCCSRSKTKPHWYGLRNSSREILLQKDPHLIIHQIEERGVVLEEMFADNAWTLKGIVLFSFSHSHVIPKTLWISFIYAFRRCFLSKATLHSRYTFSFSSVLDYPGNRTHDLGFSRAIFYCLSYRKAVCFLFCKTQKKIFWKSEGSRQHFHRKKIKVWNAIRVSKDDRTIPLGNRKHLWTDNSTE